MQTIELTMEEMEALRELLRHKIDEIDLEMLRTDTRGFKAMLKHRRELFEHMLVRLSGVPVGA